MKRLIVPLLITFALNAQPFTTENVALTPFIDVDIPVLEKGQTGVSGICSMGPFSAGAPIYSVVISLHPTIPGYKRDEAPFLLLNKDKTQFAFVGFSASNDVDLPAFATARKSYPTVAFQTGLGEITISNLNWADVADVVDTLATNPMLANTFLAKVLQNLSVKIIPITTTADLDRFEVMGALQEASTDARPLGFINTGEQWQANMTFFEQLALKAKPEERTLSVNGAIMNIGAPTTIVANTLKLAELNAATVKKLQHDVSVIGPSPSEDADSPNLNTATIKPIVIVDSPCYTVRLLPSAGGDALTSFEFNGHLLAPWSSGHNFARAEGKAKRLLEDTAGSTVNLSGEVAHNWDFRTKSATLHPRLSLGAIVTYDESETGSAKSRSESIGVKSAFSFKNPESLFGLKLLAGEETRPSINFEGHYANSENTGQAGVTAFDIRSSLNAKFRWSQTSFSRIEAAGQWSGEKKFGGRDNFAYINVDIIRIIVKNPIELAATYSCGRQPPDYKENCGFKAGISMASNQ